MRRGVLTAVIAGAFAMGLMMCGGSGPVVNTTAVAARPLADVQCQAAAGDTAEQGICFETSPEDPNTTLVRVRGPLEDRCVRVVQDGDGDGQLGYAAVHDRPNRRELEVPVHGGQTSFVFNLRPAKLANEKNYKDIDGTVSIDFFALTCGALCDHQAGDNRLVLDQQGAHVGAMRTDAGTQCPFLSQIPSMGAQDAAAESSH
jgi:hypothetical protein